jgi:hypothetical protein
MMTRDLLRKEMATSEAKEEKTYKELTLTLFREIQEPLKLLYDQTAKATEQFTQITPAVLRDHPKIIKTLRYCLAPTISQMRMGQLLGLDSTEPFEEKGMPPTSEEAKQLAKWFKDYLDKDRFQWLAKPHMSVAERGVAETYAKLWTVSLQSNQNTATKYRTQRKERQEKAIAATLESIGLKLQKNLGPPPVSLPRWRKGDPPRPKKPRRPGGIDSVNDVQAGHYVAEKKILGGSEKKQKADLTTRPSTSPQLYCIEAKAVGIRLDSTKRLKEVNEKATDWQKSKLPITTLAVIAGMFNDVELVAAIKERSIPVFFEHDLGKLGEFLKSGLYYGAKWDPASLFAEVPPEDLKAAMENIETASLDDEADADQPVEGEEGSVAEHNADYEEEE